MILIGDDAALRAGPLGDQDSIVHLPRFEVHAGRASITDFGMSVVTNFGVLFDGPVKWMRIGIVVAGSSADSLGLAKDDQIALIDRQKVTDYSRSQMLQTFFHRKPGERVALVVREARTKRWRLVELRANAPRIAP